jgi:hypothetical protein
MHPPFGFALFYLRSISDQVYKTKAIERPIKSSDIYMGAIPWVVMQLALVAIVIAWPGSVTSWLDKEEKVDVDKATELLQQMGGQPSQEPAAVPEPESAASAASAPDPEEEDPMEAVRRSLQNEPKKP